MSGARNFQKQYLDQNSTYGWLCSVSPSMFTKFDCGCRPNQVSCSLLTGGQGGVQHMLDGGAEGEDPGPGD